MKAPSYSSACPDGPASDAERCASGQTTFTRRPSPVEQAWGQLTGRQFIAVTVREMRPGVRLRTFHEAAAFCGGVN